MPKINLEPCPFCGGKANHWYTRADGKGRSKIFGSMYMGHAMVFNIIACEKCGVQTKVYKTNRVFIAWNRRVGSESNT